VRTDLCKSAQSETRPCEQNHASWSFAINGSKDWRVASHFCDTTYQSLALSSSRFCELHIIQDSATHIGVPTNWESIICCFSIFHTMNEFRLIHYCRNPLLRYSTYHFSQRQNYVSLSSLFID